jgi:hypothetical protein
MNLWDKEYDSRLTNVALHFVVCTLALALSVLQCFIQVQHAELQSNATELGWQRIEWSCWFVSNKLIAIFTCFHTHKQDSLKSIRKGDLAGTQPSPWCALCSVQCVRTHIHATFSSSSVRIPFTNCPYFHFSLHQELFDFYHMLPQVEHLRKSRCGCVIDLNISAD